MCSGIADETITVEESQCEAQSGSESLFLFSPPHPSTGGMKVGKSEGVDHLGSCCVNSADVLALNEHKEALKLQELIFQDRLLQREREIQAKENELQDVRTKLECVTEAQSQMRSYHDSL